MATQAGTGNGAAEGTCGSWSRRLDACAPWVCFPSTLIPKRKVPAEDVATLEIAHSTFQVRHSAVRRSVVPQSHCHVSLTDKTWTESYGASSDPSAVLDAVSDRELESFVNERNFEYSVAAMKSLKVNTSQCILHPLTFLWKCVAHSTMMQDDWVSSQMDTRAAEFTEFQQLSICVGRLRTV